MIGRAILIVTLLGLFSPTLSANNFKDGQLALDSGECKKAFRYWYLLDKRGDHKGSYGLGLLYQQGCAVAKDFEKAAGLFKQSELPDAYYQLGVIYEKGGYGLGQDLVFAREFYEKAYRVGLAKAAMKIYQILRKCCVGSEEYALWQRIAIERGDPLAACDHAFTSRAGGGVSVTDDPVLLNALLGCPPELLPKALVSIANDFEVIGDLQTALTYCKKGAKLGDSKGEQCVVRLTIKELLIKAQGAEADGDLQTALKYCKQAAKLRSSKGKKCVRRIINLIGGGEWQGTLAEAQEKIDKAKGIMTFLEPNNIEKQCREAMDLLTGAREIYKNAYKMARSNQRKDLVRLKGILEVERVNIQKKCDDKMMTVDNGIRAFDEKRYKRALEIFHSIEESKDQSQREVVLFYLGRMYIEGVGTPKNVHLGVKHLKQAIALGYCPAKLTLAAAKTNQNDPIYNPDTPEFDLKKILKDPSCSVIQKGKAYFYLGQLEELWREKGYSQSLSQAVKYYTFGVAAGNPDCSFALGRLVESGKTFSYQPSKDATNYYCTGGSICQSDPSANVEFRHCSDLANRCK